MMTREAIEVIGVAMQISRLPLGIDGSTVVSLHVRQQLDEAVASWKFACSGEQDKLYGVSLRPDLERWMGC